MVLEMGNIGHTVWAIPEISGKKMDNADISVSNIIGFISYRVSQNLI